MSNYLTDLHMYFCQETYVSTKPGELRTNCRVARCTFGTIGHSADSLSVCWELTIYDPDRNWRYKMRKIRNPIIDPRTNIFRHGRHAGSTISEVFRDDPGYLEFLSYEAKGLHPKVMAYILREYHRLCTMSTPWSKAADRSDKDRMRRNVKLSGSGRRR